MITYGTYLYCVEHCCWYWVEHWSTYTVSHCCLATGWHCLRYLVPHTCSQSEVSIWSRDPAPTNHSSPAATPSHTPGTRSARTWCPTPPAVTAMLPSYLPL